ncbi:MAG: RNA 2',3'-cyclic phosphodiesterase [Alphaproteobacteria bacterium]|nr:RNA 2',3'-cyclic phosphodiesterase [Alphaproteobacteria bacterium]
MIRLFVGIELPPELRLRVSLLCGGIPGAKWVDPGNLHLTLRFIGEVDEGTASDIDETLAQIRAPRFTLTLAGTGHFGSGDTPRALWVGVERNPALYQLHDKIEAALMRLGLPPEQRRYSPHVTLARLKQVAVPRLQAFLHDHALFRAEPFTVEHFSLIASYPTKSGSIYEDQADYALT